MPSHSPYALSNLTVLVLKNYIRIRVLFVEIEVLPKILLFSEKPFPHFLQIFLSAGFDIFMSSSLSSYLSSFDITLFSFQGTTLNM